VYERHLKAGSSENLCDVRGGYLEHSRLLSNLDVSVHAILDTSRSTGKPQNCPLSPETGEQRGRPACVVNHEQYAIDSARCTECWKCLVALLTPHGNQAEIRVHVSAEVLGDWKALHLAIDRERMSNDRSVVPQLLDSLPSRDQSD